MASKNSFNRYGVIWTPETTDLAIELYCIRHGGRFHWRGQPAGWGLYHHYKQAMTLLWPKDDWHRWAELQLHTILDNEISVFMGCGDSGKTRIMGKFALLDWWAFPDDTLWLVSSTEYRGAEMRIWGDIKYLFNIAMDGWESELCGTVLESMHAITTAEISDDRKRARSLQRGLLFVPCKKGGEYVGLSAFVGAKAPRLRHAGDEVQFLTQSFLDAFSNWYGKRDFKSIMAGNPTSIRDPLCFAGQPECGWDAWRDTGKTQTWRSRFFGASVVALDGRDSPNFDYPQDQPAHFHYLHGKKRMEAVVKTYGTSSWRYWQQCVGKPNPQMGQQAVLTRQLCEEHHAFDMAEWLNTRHTHVAGVDPNYGGEDRATFTHAEFGDDADGRPIMKFYPAEVIPVTVSPGSKGPEDQIAEWLKQRLHGLGIPPENCFYDSTGKGTMGNAFSRVFGSAVPVAVDSGGMPTDRPVRHDLFIEDNGHRRIKTCREEYSKFVTEMAFSVREIVEGDQAREFQMDVLDEFTMRLYEIVKGNKTEIEPKDDMKERLTYSPDLMDCTVICVEGARQRGFRILRLGSTDDEGGQNDWFTEEEDKYADALKGALLIHQ